MLDKEDKTGNNARQGEAELLHFEKEERLCFFWKKTMWHEICANKEKRKVHASYSNHIISDAAARLKRTDMALLCRAGATNSKQKSSCSRRILTWQPPPRPSW